MVLVGCKGPSTYALSGEWHPLRQISERGPVVGLVVTSDTKIYTIGDTVYVKDLENYLKRKPPGSVQFKAQMRHEQEHAIRQRTAGLRIWLTRYGYNTRFAWLEEQCGWYYELIALQKAGLRINVDGVAAVLAGYKNLSGHITTFEEAKKWTLDVLQGRWTPPSK